ncbi:epididymal-specific lipocalin-8 [Thomomys bottae]
MLPTRLVGLPVASPSTHRERYKVPRPAPACVWLGCGRRSQVSAARCMEGKALVALLGLCVGLAARTQSATLQDFDFSKFSGLWYEIAFASKMGVLSSPHKLEKMGGVLIKLEENHISLSTTHFSEEGCVLEQVSALPGDAPGKFKVIRKSGDKEIEILDTNYKSYAIMCVSLQVAGDVQRMMKLYRDRAGRGACHG